MDKNEYNLRLEEINKNADQGNFEEAAAIADSIDWKRVRNVRTLCFISEIYEAVDRPEDSKQLLLRAYRRSPLGKSVLYRLTEVTITLKQFDEAIEYYSEYIQAAPHDNNRYILKYKIYRGRGSSVDEQIDILKEYLDQEYNEKYAYELAKLYQQADRIQECLAACDDLVLWFHSGHYVLKALELKQRYAALTPKQQDIYERERTREESGEEEDEELLGQEKQMVDVEETDAADHIMEDTAREIAEAVKASVEDQKTEEAEETEAAAAGEEVSPASGNTVIFDAEAIRKARAESARLAEEAENRLKEEASASEEAEEETEAAEEASMQPEMDEDTEEIETQEAEEDTDEEEPEGEAPAAASVDYDPESLQSDVAQDVLDLVAGVGVRDEVDPDEEVIDQVIEASKKDQENRMSDRGMDLRTRMTDMLRMPQKSKPAAARLSIDDVLESMGEKGNAVRQAAARAGAAPASTPKGVLSAVDEALLNMGRKPQTMQEDPKPVMEDSIADIAEVETPMAAEAAVPELGEDIDTMEGIQEEVDNLQTGDTRPMPKAEDLEAVLQDAVESAAVPQEITEEDTSDTDETAAAEDAADEVDTAEEISDDAEQAEVDAFVEEDLQDMEPEETIEASELSEEAPAAEAPVVEAAIEEAEEIPEESPSEEEPAEEEPFDEEEDSEPEETEIQEAEAEEEQPAEDPQDMSMGDIINARTRRIPREQIEQELKAKEDNRKEGTIRRERKARKGRQIPSSVREYFDGFTQVPDLEMQIALSLQQALSKGKDRTSRGGNILIFGSHGSGKTTLATALAKSIAQLQGREYVKMARIYATDFNRKDIASTIAKIAGGILIIEEAGDMEDAIADQLTTAMEFRTDGLVLILEDEEKYLRNLLMRHPRFTMKFTSQIYLPSYTVDDLVNFAEQIAGENDCTLSQEAADALAGRLDGMISGGTVVSLIDIREMVEKAVKRAGKISRKVFGGKKRYDEYGRILLQAKDVR